MFSSSAALTVILFSGLVGCAPRQTGETIVSVKDIQQPSDIQDNGIPLPPDNHGNGIPQPPGEDEFVSPPTPPETRPGMGVGCGAEIDPATGRYPDYCYDVINTETCDCIMDDIRTDIRSCVVDFADSNLFDRLIEIQKDVERERDNRRLEEGNDGDPAGYLRVMACQRRGDEIRDNLTLATTTAAAATPTTATPETALTTPEIPEVSKAGPEGPEAVGIPEVPAMTPRAVSVPDMIAQPPGEEPVGGSPPPPHETRPGMGVGCASQMNEETGRYPDYCYDVINTETCDCIMDDIRADIRSCVVDFADSNLFFRLIKIQKKLEIERDSRRMEELNQHGDPTAYLKVADCERRGRKILQEARQNPDTEPQK